MHGHSGIMTIFFNLRGKTDEESARLHVSEVQGRPVFPVMRQRIQIEDDLLFRLFIHDLVPGRFIMTDTGKVKQRPVVPVRLGIGPVFQHQIHGLVRPDAIQRSTDFFRIPVAEGDLERHSRRLNVKRIGPAEKSEYLLPQRSRLRIAALFERLRRFLELHAGKPDFAKRFIRLQFLIHPDILKFLRQTDPPYAVGQIGHRLVVAQIIQELAHGRRLIVLLPE